MALLHTRLYARSCGEFPVWEWVLAFFAFFPIFTNFLQGQDAILLLLLFVLGFRAMDRDADFLAGCWLGLGRLQVSLRASTDSDSGVVEGQKAIAGIRRRQCQPRSCFHFGLLVGAERRSIRHLPGAWYPRPATGKRLWGLLPNLLGLVTGWPFLAGMLLCAGSCSGLGEAGVRSSLACGASLKIRQFFKICFACAVTTAVLVGYNTNAHDLSFLILPLALLCGLCAFPLPPWSGDVANRCPVVPLLISPLWFFLWMRWEHTNLMAIFLLWWLYAIRRKFLRMKGSTRRSDNTTSPA